MNKIISLFIAVLFYVYSSAQTNLESTKDSLMTLDEMPSWVLSNIQFPQEAYKYGIAGIEQVCISASWDGKVFITSMLNTLNLLNGNRLLLIEQIQLMLLYVTGLL